MIIVPRLYGAGSVQLFEQDKTGHFMGKGKPGQGLGQVGVIKYRFIQAQVSADEKANGL